MKKAIFILISSVLFACQDIDSCTNDPNRSFMTVRFFDFETKAARKGDFEVTVSPVNDPNEFSLDSTFFSTDSTTIFLLLDPVDTAMVFNFDADTSFQLDVKYSIEYSIFDPACDPSIRFIAIDTLLSTFDSTAILGRGTDREIPTNIEVYY